MLVNIFSFLFFLLLLLSSFFFLFLIEFFFLCNVQNHVEIKSVITEIVWGEGTYEALQRYCASKTDHLEFYTSPEDAKMAIEGMQKEFIFCTHE